MSPNREFFRFIAAFPLLLAPFGCALSPSSDVPADLAQVFADSGRFAQTPGTVTGQAAQVPADETCLGAFAEVCPSGETTCAQVWQTLRFVPESQQLTRETAQSLAALPPVIDVWTGHYTVMAEGQLRFEVTSVRSNVPGPALTDITDQFAPLPVYDVYLTEANGAIRVEFRTPADDPRTPAGLLENLPLVHQSFDCAGQTS